MDTETDRDLLDEPPPYPPEGGYEGGWAWPSWTRKLAFLVPIGVLAIILALVALPYYVVGPGPARDVPPLIHIEDHRTYPSSGRLLLTAVNLTQANIYEIVDGWLDPAKDVIPERELFPENLTEEQERQVSLSEMDTSKIDAAVVALSALTDYPGQAGRGLLVERVLGGSPADGKLFAGDLLVAVDGQELGGFDDLRRRADETGLGGTLTFMVEAGGETRTERVVLGRVPGVEGPGIGISTVANFPFPLVIESGDIGGPSAGLMWALGLVELLGPDDLTDGRVIAGTGTLGLDGSVGPIGGVEEKVVAAERAGAEIFFVPVDDAAAARAIAGDMTVVPVRTYQDAIDYLDRTD
jgi:PDZ domain-containing protein